MLYFLIKTALVLMTFQLTAIGTFRQCLNRRYRTIVTPGDVLPILAITVVGLFAHDANVFYALLFVIPLFWARDPAGLARRYVLVLVLFPGLKQVYSIGSLYVGTVSAFTFFNAGALVALTMTRRGRLKPVRSIDAAVWMLFLITLLLSARGVEIGGTLREVAMTVLLIVPPYFIIARAVGSGRVAGDVAAFMVMGGLCNTVVALFESIYHWAIYETFNVTLNVRILGTSANLAMRAGLLRAGGAVSNYEVLGLLTGMALIAAVAIRRRFTTPGFYAVVALLAAGLFASQARSAWIAALAGLVLQAAYDRRWQRVGIITGGIGLIGGLVFALSSSDGMIGQLLGKSGHAESTSQYRQKLLDRGLEEAARHPLTGQTLDQLQVSMNDLRQGEQIIDFVNTHLYVMLVGGVGALVLWVLVWTMPLLQGWRARARPLRDPDGISAGLPVAMAGMTFLYLTFTSPIDRILSLAAIGMGLMSVCLRLAGRPAASVRPDESSKPSHRIAGRALSAL